MFLWRRKRAQLKAEQVREAYLRRVYEVLESCTKPRDMDRSLESASGEPASTAAPIPDVAGSSASLDPRELPGEAVALDLRFRVAEAD